MEAEKEPEELAVEITNPIIVNMGKQKNKRIKKLIKGKGKLWDEVDDVIDEVAETLGEEMEGKVIIPLVLVYRKKPKRKKSRFLGL